MCVSNEWLKTAWLFPDNCMILWQLPYDGLDIFWWLPEDCQTTASSQHENCQNCQRFPCNINISSYFSRKVKWNIIFCNVILQQHQKLQTYEAASGLKTEINLPHFFCINWTKLKKTAIVCISPKIICLLIWLLNSCKIKRRTKIEINQTYHQKYYK